MSEQGKIGAVTRVRDTWALMRQLGLAAERQLGLSAERTPSARRSPR